MSKVYDLGALAKRMAERYNSRGKSINIETVKFIVKCHDLVVAPDVQPDDEIGYSAYWAQRTLREVWDDIVDADENRGYVVVKDGTIRCITSSSYIAQFDGCQESEVSYPHMDR